MRKPTNMDSLSTRIDGAEASAYTRQLFVPEGSTLPASRNGCPTTDQVRGNVPRGFGALAEEVETAIVALLTRPQSTDETHLVAAQRREDALREIFDDLTAAQGLMLCRRLDADRDADRVAVAFRRLTVERRQRLRGCLADMRRRHAHKTGTIANERSISEEE